MHRHCNLLQICHIAASQHAESMATDAITVGNNWLLTKLFSIFNALGPLSDQGCWQRLPTARHLTALCLRTCTVGRGHPGGVA